MNRFGSPPIHLLKNDGVPHQGLWRGTAGRVLLIFFIDPPRGRPYGGGGILRYGWTAALAPRD
jgi:hypothetical protein